VATGTRATALLTGAGVRFTLHPYSHDASDESGFGAEAARRLGVDPARMFKTLIGSADRAPVCALVPVDRRLDVKALAVAVGAKRAGLAAPAVATRVSGYVLGGVSPLGLRTPLPVFVDESAARYETVYISAGRRGLQVELAPADLITLCGGRFAPLAVAAR
jgi:Cys-tRNA(Pro)/Cys-tRNA(Cys) deacylase